MSLDKSSVGIKRTNEFYIRNDQVDLREGTYKITITVKILYALSNYQDVKEVVKPFAVHGKATVIIGNLRHLLTVIQNI